MGMGLRGWVETAPHDWLVLSLRLTDSSSYIAFMALGMEPTENNGCRLYMAGEPLSAHTGFICLSEHVSTAIPTFSHFVQERLSWDRLDMRDVLDPRLDTFLDCFPTKKFAIRLLHGSPCPYIPALPKTWDQYLEGSLGKWARRDLRRAFKQIANSGTELFITDARSDNFEHHIEALLTVWQLRWGVKSEKVLNRYRCIFRRCFEYNSLWLSVLWDGTTPISALAALMDRQRKSFNAYLLGRDPESTKMKKPGKTIYGYSVRYAIENGFSIFDFGRGDEDFKYELGAQRRMNTHVIIVRKTLRITLSRLKRRIERVPKRVLANS